MPKSVECVAQQSLAFLQIRGYEYLTTQELLHLEAAVGLGMTNQDVLNDLNVIQQCFRLCGCEIEEFVLWLEANDLTCSE